MIVEGQVHGGIAQGVGQALLENAVYDESGQLVTASYMDYAMPRADDLPSFDVGMTVTPCPSNPLGIKGCGEAGAICRAASRDQRHHQCCRPRGRAHARDAARGLARDSQDQGTDGGGVSRLSDTLCAGDQLPARFIRISEN